MYEVKHLLGSGSAGDAWLCRDRATGELLAVKLMKRPIPRVMGSNIMREVKIGAQLGRGHLNIVKPKELILTRTHLGIVMEYVAGGNMADYILKTILLKFGSFDTRDGLVMEEDEARYFFTQVINAVDYCHKNKVAHRDLKMDNTLLDDNDPPRVKLCDFGFAKWWTDKPCMCTITGTPDYMSPELLGAKAQRQAQALYDGTKADIWAAGVMLCVMLIGRFPFEGVEMSNATNLEEVSLEVWKQQNSACWYKNPLIAQDCLLLSPECIDLLNRMFTLDCNARITIPEIRSHAWYSKPLPPPYSVALADLYNQQDKINEQVRSGAFVSSDRDAALARMIEAASVRYSPEQEKALLQEPVPAAHGGKEGGGGGDRGLARLSASLLRKISLGSIQLQHQEAGATDVTHVSLNSLSTRFANTAASCCPDTNGQQGGPAVAMQADSQQTAQPLPAVALQPQQAQQQQLQLSVAADGVQLVSQQQQQQQQLEQQQHLPPPPQLQAGVPMEQLSKQQQQEQYTLRQQQQHSNSSQPSHFASPAGSNPGQPPGQLQGVQLTDGASKPAASATAATAATAAAAAAAAAVPSSQPSQLSDEIQVA